MGVLNGLPWFFLLQFWIITIVTVATIVLLLWAAWIIYFESKYVWLIKMLCLLILADICLLFTNAGYVVEINQQFESNHLLLLKMMTAVGTSGLNLFLNVFHWLFSYEYLQVSFSFNLDHSEFKAERSSQS